MAEEMDGMENRLEDRKLRYLSPELDAAVCRDRFLAETEHVDRLDLGKRGEYAQLRDRAKASAIAGGPEEVRGEVKNPHVRTLAIAC